MAKLQFRLPRFSLKSLFLAIFVVACLLGWIKWRGSNRSAPHLMLRRTGVEVKFDPFGDQECKWLANMPRLKSLGVDRTEITDIGAEDLARCKNLRSLSLSGCRVTDRSVRALSESLSLTDIGLDHTLVTGESLRYLSKMPSIQTISIWDCPVADADLKPLENCPALYCLDLSGTKITTDALPELAKIKGLKQVTAIHTPLSRSVAYRTVSPEEIARLLPGVIVSLFGNR